jgi:hypothetical protein
MLKSRVTGGLAKFWKKAVITLFWLVTGRPLEHELEWLHLYQTSLCRSYEHTEPYIYFVLIQSSGDARLIDALKTHYSVKSEKTANPHQQNHYRCQANGTYGHVSLSNCPESLQNFRQLKTEFLQTNMTIYVFGSYLTGNITYPLWRLAYRLFFVLLILLLSRLVCSTFVRNADELLPDYTVSHPGREYVCKFYEDTATLTCQIITSVIRWNTNLQLKQPVT